MVASIMYSLFGVALALVCARDMNFSFMPHQDPADTSMTDDSHFAEQVLSHHNYFRGQHNAAALTWNASMAATAEQWASSCTFKHSQAGQNLVAGFPTVAHSIDAWGLERQQYDWNQPGFDDNTGHFTQLVWKDTSELGCGRKLCPAGTIFPDFEVWYVVCNYANAGNVVGGASNNEFFVEHVDQQVSGSPAMGVVSLLSSVPDESQRGLAIKSLLAVEELQVKAINLAGLVREEVSGIIAALAAKVF